MFGRKKSEEPPAPVAEAPPQREGAKNRPTPTRREREQARRQPLVPDDRKAAAKQARDQARRERDQERQAMLTGDERNLGPRDGGQVRRFVRDVVDARFNVSEFFLLIALAVVIVVLGPQLLGLSTVLTAQFQLVTTAVLWITIALVALDEVRLVLRLRKALRERFGADFDTRGHVSYGVSRSLQIRRWRLPRPAVSRGQAPRS